MFLVMHKSTQWMMYLIDGILDYGAILRNKFSPKLEVFNIENEVAEAYSIVSPSKMKSDKIKFNTKYAKRVPTGNANQSLNKLRNLF